MSRQRFAEAWLCLTLAFDTLVFLAITVITFLKTKKYGFIPLIDVIQKDGVTYFFVLFSSNLLWLVLLLHARVSSHSRICPSLRHDFPDMSNCP